MAALVVAVTTIVSITITNTNMVKNVAVVTTKTSTSMMKNAAERKTVANTNMVTNVVETTILTSIIKNINTTKSMLLA